MNKILSAAAAALLAAGAAHAQTVGIAASNPGSLYHSTGTAVAKLANDVAKMQATVYPFASATIYLPAVNAGEYAFGVSNVEELRVAVLGIEQFKGRPYPDLRAVAILYPLRVTYFVRKDSDIRRMADLKGKRVTDGFGSQKTVPPLLDALLATGGLTRADTQPVNVPNVVGAADAFISGKADAFFFALGAAKVEEANASVGGIRALDVANTPENLAKVQKFFPPAYLRPEKPGPRNIGVLEPIHALAYDGVLVASTKTPDEVVYRMAQSMHGNKKVMAQAFGAMNLFDPERMATPLGPIQWHAGAVRFYTEQGVWPPK
ncbi:MAG TPA: TAXI family TRAP transporter solute-binding subunit [Burkholderiales bacterium]|nr:TAXI family TRAP transporter solute-binding subunit [Burkholderiales bacterium]